MGRSKLRRMVVLTALVLGLSAFTAAFAPSADALAVFQGRLDSYPNYTGWAYVANTTSTTAWKWSSTGWTAASLTPGQSVWAAPYGSGWQWAYRGGSWYAIQSKYLVAWQCAASSGTYTVPGRTIVYHYNTSHSESYGVLAGGTTAKLVCSNSFSDAWEAPGTMYCLALGCGPTRYYLVDSQPLPGCMVPTAPGQPICMIAMPADGFPSRRGYVAIPQVLPL